MMSDTCKMQWSQFVGDGGQVVVRADDAEEFASLYVKMREFMESNDLKPSDKGGKMASAPTMPLPIRSVAEQLDEKLGGTYKCQTCGETAEVKSGTSKAGKPYKGAFCTANREHTPQWLS